MSRIRADRMLKERDRIAEALAMLTDARLKEIERRSQMNAQPDGYGNGSGDSTSGGDVSRPTETTVLQILDGRPMRDDQMTSFRIIEAELKTMVVSAKRIERAWSVVEHINDGRRGREATLDSCNACLRSDITGVGNDRIRSGYCNACFHAYLKAGRPDRLVFEMQRRNQPDEVDIPSHA